MKQSFWQSPLTRSSVPKDKVTTPETLLGYLIGPFGALLSSGIFTSYLQVYLGKALELSSAYLSIHGGQGAPVAAALRADAFRCQRADVHHAL